MDVAKVLTSRLLPQPGDRLRRLRWRYGETGAQGGQLLVVHSLCLNQLLFDQWQG